MTAKPRFFFVGSCAAAVVEGEAESVTMGFASLMVCSSSSYWRSLKRAPWFRR
jgi:hypothetical protein